MAPRPGPPRGRRRPARWGCNSSPRMWRIHERLDVPGAVRHWIKVADRRHQPLGSEVPASARDLVTSTVEARLYCMVEWLTRVERAMSAVGRTTQAHDQFRPCLWFPGLLPGPLPGGHCIPIDPFYLTWVSGEHGLTSQFIELAGEINTSMAAYVVSRGRRCAERPGQAGRVGRDHPLERGLQEGCVRSTQVSKSPSLPFVLMEHLLEKGAEV